MDDVALETAEEQWQREAASLAWSAPYGRLFDGTVPPGRWMVDGTLNAAVNCCDRHAVEHPDRLAIRWHGEPGDTRDVSYGELAGLARDFAAGLRELGVRPSDRVAIHLSPLVETVVAMLACARIGAAHVLLPPMLPSDVLADRLRAARPKVLVTQDAAWLHGELVPTKERADEAVAANDCVEHTVVVRRTGAAVEEFAGDRSFSAVLADGHNRLDPIVDVPADHPLLLAFLANRRGKPIGIVHRTAGFLLSVGAFHRYALTEDASDTVWCALDLTWMAGQAHAIYGPLVCGGTTVLTEGTLDVPDGGRLWRILEAFDVGTLVTTPSVLRQVRRWLPDSPLPPVSRLRRVVTVGEPGGAEVRGWLEQLLADSRVQTADAWGQTELAAGVSVGPKDPSGMLPSAGMQVIDRFQERVEPGEVGELVLTNPWPGTMLGILGDTDGQLARAYWTRRERTGWWYRTGDAARREADGSISVLGRLDPVVSVSGQLVSTAEVREVLVEHPHVVAAEVVGRPDEVRGQAVVAWVQLSPAIALESVREELASHVREALGGLAVPAAVFAVDAFPAAGTSERLRWALAQLCRDSRDRSGYVTREQIAAAARGTPTGLHLASVSWPVPAG